MDVPPRPDSPPVFGRLLDPEGGHFSIASPPSSMAYTTSQSYLPNTNILLTTVTLSNGDAFQIMDFCPRFEQYGLPPCFVSSSLCKAHQPLW